MKNVVGVGGEWQRGMDEVDGEEERKEKKELGKEEEWRKEEEERKEKKALKILIKMIILVIETKGQ